MAGISTVPPPQEALTGPGGMSRTWWRFFQNTDQQVREAIPAQITVINGNVAALSRQQPYDIATFLDGALGASPLTVFRLEMVRSVVLPVGLAGSLATCGLLATNPVTLTLARNGAAIGTIAFAAGASSGSFVAPVAVTLLAGDVLTLTYDGGDWAFGDLSVTLSGTRASTSA